MRPPTKSHSEAILAIAEAGGRIVGHHAVCSALNNHAARAIVTKGHAVEVRTQDGDSMDFDMMLTDAGWKRARELGWDGER